MATSEDYIKFVCSQIEDAGVVRYRKMFGEYMAYLDEKPVFLVCDNTVYVKIIKPLSELLQDCETDVPYSGAKEHYILDIEDKELSVSVSKILAKNYKVKHKRTEKKAK